MTAGAPSRRAARRAAVAVLRTRPRDRASDAALLAVRAALAWIFVAYGGGKLFGWWHGPGIHETAVFFAGTAHLRPGGLFAVAAGVLELAGGVAMALGVAARPIGAALAAEMAVAVITVTGAHGLHSTTGSAGYEINVALAALALVVALLGPGRFSVDALAARRTSTTDASHMAASASAAGPFPPRARSSP